MTGEAGMAVEQYKALQRRAPDDACHFDELMSGAVAGGLITTWTIQYSFLVNLTNDAPSSAIALVFLGQLRHIASSGC
jgi:hypothetical protein